MFNIETYVDLFLENIPTNESVIPLPLSHLDRFSPSNKVRWSRSSQPLGVYHADPSHCSALCKISKSRSVRESHEQLVSAFFTHYYNGQWANCLCRISVNSDDFLKAIRTELKPYANEMITDWIEEKNEIVAVRAAKYNMQGNRIMYDGFWTHYQYNVRGQLYLGVYFSNKEKKTASEMPEAVLYDGEFNMGERNGYGKELNGHGWILYEGTFRKDKYHGKGKLYYAMGNLRYEGDFENGQYSGKGKEYDFTGFMKYDGRFKNGKRHGEGNLYIAPHYFQNMGYYGKHNEQAYEIYYHRIENCNLEDLNYGDRNEMLYTNEIFEVYQNKGLPECLEEKKAYICNENEVNEN